MKNVQISLIVIAALLIGGILLSGSIAQTTAPASGPAHVAVCDIVAVFNDYQRAKDLTNEFNQRREALKVENEKRVKQIESIQQELDSLDPSSKEYNDRQNEVQRLTIERKAWMEFQENLAMRDHHRLTKQMYEEITAKVGKVSKDMGYEIVLFRERGAIQSDNTQDLLRQIASRKVLYADESVDITDSVLTRMNEDYKRNK
jgi:Skp family chaperone for outer membrane proteins